MTNEIKNKLVEKTMKDMLETLSSVEKYVLIEKIVDLQQRIYESIKYCEESSKIIKSEYFSDVIKILRGDE